MDGIIIIFAIVALVGLGLIAALRVIQGAWRVVLLLIVIALVVGVALWYNAITQSGTFLL